MLTPSPEVLEYLRLFNLAFIIGGTALCALCLVGFRAISRWCSRATEDAVIPEDSDVFIKVVAGGLFLAAFTFFALSGPLSPTAWGFVVSPETTLQVIHLTSPKCK